MTLEYKPTLERGMSGLQQDGRAQVNLTNVGKRIQITGVNSSHDNFITGFYVKPPYWWEKDIKLAFHASAKDNSNMNNQSFESYIIVRNELLQDYQITLYFRGPSIKIGEPESI
jgi:hypothetical protein